MGSPLVHVCVLGALLFVGVILRTRVQLLKTFFIPASLIAGLLGLVLGPYGLKVIPDEMIATFAMLPPILITVVFAPMLMGMRLPKLKNVGGMVGPQLLFGYIGDFLLIAAPLLITGLVIAPLWGANEMFGTLIEIGWPGGHGTAGGMAEVFTELGWEDGGPLGLTAATIGLFIGIIVGMIIINNGVRKGHTLILKPDHGVQRGDKPDLVPKAKQSVGSHITVNKEVVEPLAYHFGLIACAVLVGAVLLYGLESLSGLNLPLFPMAMVGGLIVQFTISKTQYADSVDSGSLSLIQGLALELLIVSAITTIKVPVVIAFAVPLLLVSLVSLAVLLFHFHFLGPRLFKTQWFEHSIVNFGALAGVTAVGLMLLRTVDPEMKTDAAKAYAMRAPFLSPIIGGGLLTSVLPILVINYGAVTIGLVFLAASGALVVLAKLFGFWHPPQS